MDSACGVSANCWKEIPKYSLSLSDLSPGAVQFFFFAASLFSKVFDNEHVIPYGGENLIIKGQTIESLVLVMHS